MSGLLDRLWYNFRDAFGKKSYAESQRDKYKKVIDNVNEKLGCMTDFEDAVEILKRDTDNMELNPYSAEGKFDRTYKEKEANHRRATKTLGDTYRQYMEAVQTQLVVAQEKYEYWCSEADREDRKMKEYEKEYYDELEKEQNKKKGK